MNKEWLDEKTAKYNEDIEKGINRVLDFLRTCPYYDNSGRTKAIDEIHDLVSSDNCNYLLTKYSNVTDIKERHTLRDQLKDLDLDGLASTIFHRNYLINYLDSEPMQFDNGIIITDPCYIMRTLSEKEKEQFNASQPKEADFLRFPSVKEYPDSECLLGDIYTSKMYDEDMSNFSKAISEHGRKYNDWVRSDYGSALEELGIVYYISRDTIYGDWSCSVFRDDGSTVGEFCADAGMVMVADYNEVLAYNPDFEKKIKECPWSVTAISDFKGTVQFKVVETKWTWEEDTEYHKKGDVGIDYSVEVVGRGILKSTGEEFNFVSKQTGF